MEGQSISFIEGLIFQKSKKGCTKRENIQILAYQPSKIVDLIIKKYQQMASSL